MAQVTINANRSVFIDANSATSNFDAAPQLDVGESNISAEKRRGLIGFDILTQQPVLVGATLTNVDFKIYDGGGDLTNNARTMHVAQLLTDWVENQATWNIRKSATNWGTAGASNAADRSSSLGNQSMPNPPVAGYKTITLTTAEIQKWIDGTIVDNGLTIYMETETDDMHRFEGSGETNKPQLVIDYTPAPVVGGTPMFFGGGVTIG